MIESNDQNNISVVASYTRAADCRYPLKMESRTKKGKQAVSLVLHVQLDRCTVPNDALSGFRVLQDLIGDERTWYNELTYHNICKVGIQYSAIFVVSPMNLKKVGTEILNDGFVVIRAVTKRRDTTEIKVQRRAEAN